jgi:hypothetical protein
MNVQNVSATPDLTGVNQTETDIAPEGATSPLRWSALAPRGGRAVMNRILKEKAQVPLFFAQTLIESLRDVGYNHTTSALCEHVDNAIGAAATEVRVFFRQRGKKGQYTVDAAVFDNGRGMSPSTLRVATSFGGSMTFNNREGIGRYGMGMKTAALSMSPVMELYSWQEREAFYNMTLDVDAIGKDRSNLVELSEPALLVELPGEITEMLTTPMVWPDTKEQILLSKPDRLKELLPASGTIVYMPACDRLTYAKARTLAEHAVKEMSRVYRQFIHRGLKLYVNNRRVEAFDPTYSMEGARHVAYLEQEPRFSRLLFAKAIDIPISVDSSSTGQVLVRLYRLPIEEWSALPRKTLRNDLQVYGGHTVSILRNGREVYAGSMESLTTSHSVTNWYRIQIDFPGTLDEAFGVAANKQGVRLKGYVEDAIKQEIGGDIATLNDELKRLQGQLATQRKAATPSVSERRASDTDSFQAKALRELTEEEKGQLDANLKGLSIALKRDNETEEEAFERVKQSKYLMHFKHDEYWPFYHVEHRFGRVILTINTAHGFFTQLYDPVRKFGVGTASVDGSDHQDGAEGPVVALELLLLSLARTQSILAQNSPDVAKVLESLRREWSEAYRVQLAA